jgi:hypothetical protein
MAVWEEQGLAGVCVTAAAVCAGAAWLAGDLVKSAGSLSLND